MKCPDCGGELVQEHAPLALVCYECPKCESEWQIYKTRDGAATRRAMDAVGAFNDGTSWWKPVTA